MKSTTKLVLLLTLLKLFFCATQTNEKELFRISTLSTTYNQYQLAENKNQYNYLFVQIILCHYPYSVNHMSIVNSENEILFQENITSSTNFIINIPSETSNNLIINITSSEMYLQYQYIEDSMDIIHASGNIKDYTFETNYISFNMSPVVANTETTYDLYYLGKINIYNDICQKVVFVLENDPISTITYTGNDYFDLKFENIEHKTGYYLIKGNNVDGISYYYFYERINVVNRLGPYPTNNVEFFEVKEETDEYYTVFTTPGNINNNEYINIQIILCNNFGDQKSHIQVFNQNNEEIFFSDIVVSRQVTLELLTYTNITIVATSPHMFIQYQYTNFYRYIMPYGIINSYDFNLDDKYLFFNVTPIMKSSSSFYELYFEKDKSENNCQMLIHTLKNKPISSLNAYGDQFTELLFNLTEKWNNGNGYVFVKSNNVDETNYTYFYEILSIKGEKSSISTLLWVCVYGMAGLCFIAIIVVIYILLKQGCCKRERDDEQPNSISLVDRSTAK